MKKIFITGAAVVLGALLFSGCSTKSTGMGADAKTAGYTHLPQHMPLKEVHNLIKKAGEKEGWRMTEFKENALIAEKTDNGTTKAVTIDFSNNFFHLTPADDDLHDAIKDALEETLHE